MSSCLVFFLDFRYQSSVFIRLSFILLKRRVGLFHYQLFLKMTVNCLIFSNQQSHFQLFLYGVRFDSDDWFCLLIFCIQLSIILSGSCVRLGSRSLYLCLGGDESNSRPLQTLGRAMLVILQYSLQVRRHLHHLSPPPPHKPQQNTINNTTTTTTTASPWPPFLVFSPPPHSLCRQRNIPHETNAPTRRVY